MLFTIFPKPLKRPAAKKEAPPVIVEAPVVEEASVVEEVVVAAEVDTSFLDEFTKRELLAWSEEQGWDLINRQPKTDILAQCKEIALGTFDGTRLA